jgi:hypothetical protein
MCYIFFTSQCNRMEFGIVPTQLLGHISMLTKIQRLFARVLLVSRYVYLDFYLKHRLRYKKLAVFYF